MKRLMNFLKVMNYVVLVISCKLPRIIPDKAARNILMEFCSTFQDIWEDEWNEVCCAKAMIAPAYWSHVEYISWIGYFHNYQRHITSSPLMAYLLRCSTPIEVDFQVWLDEEQKFHDELDNLWLEECEQLDREYHDAIAGRIVNNRQTFEVKEPCSVCNNPVGSKSLECMNCGMGIPFERLWPSGRPICDKCGMSSCYCEACWEDTQNAFGGSCSSLPQQTVT